MDLYVNKPNIDFCLDFMGKAHIYTKNPAVVQYLTLFEIPIDIIVDIQNPSYCEVAKRLVQVFLSKPKLIRRIQLAIAGADIKLDLVDKFSPEQIAFVTTPDVSDTKLCACAGSGKTRSIIGRIRFMVEFGLATPESIFAITFSKHAANDFRRKVKALYPDYETFCIINNFSTIDSLAKSILCKVKSHKSENVDILSIAFRNFLQTCTQADVEFILGIKNIRHLFIDEAQDLNQTQYDIAILLKEKFGTNINLIGDPNQNIFQFRNSSSYYFMYHQARRFDLTFNFRSSNKIIEFSEGIKPINTARSFSATGKTGPPVIIINKSVSEIHNYMLMFIRRYEQFNDLSNIAIICPTRGIGNFDTVGLSIIFNFLKLNHIKFHQLYDEAGCSDERNKIIGSLPNHVNLLTYHGSKGLEFDVVFVMDFYQQLFNIDPSESEHDVNKYLLYVATSRAINTMFVCTYTNTHSGFLNHWITGAPSSSYYSDQQLSIAKLRFREEIKISIYAITKIINELNENQLNMVDDILQIKEGVNCYSKRIYKDFTNIDRFSSEALFGTFTEELFYLLFSLNKHEIPRKFKLIKKLLKSDYTILESDTDCNMLRTFISLNDLTWEKYDMIKKDLPKRLCGLIESNFSRAYKIENAVVCTNDFVNIMAVNRDDIAATYSRYLQPDAYNWNYQEILTDFFYLIVVQYAYDNNHYHYIYNHAQDKTQLLENGMELYEAMNTHIVENYANSVLKIKVPVTYKKLSLVGEIDFIDQTDNSDKIVEIKCVRDIRLTHYLQLLLYNFCYNHKKSYVNRRGENTLLFKNTFRIINLLTGIQHDLIFKISPANMFNILNIVAEVGSLNWQNLNLVYDLETTERIFRQQLSRPPARLKFNERCFQLADKYILESYPEITEISVKDYDTGMVVIDSLVSTRNPIPLSTQELTGITNEMTRGQPDIANIRVILKKKMQYIKNCTMLAHNGSGFDNKIMLFYNLLDEQRVEFLDTMSIIPIHLPAGVKLVKGQKKLSEIYRLLFGRGFPAHRAMADVNALICIMRKLKIKI